jgi:hypothetical protein
MAYLFPEDEQLNTDLTPEAPAPEGDYLFGPEEEEVTPPVQPQSQFQHRPAEPDIQIFPTGQDHVAREVLGLKPKPFQRSDVLPESHFGILGDFGSGLASGVLQTAETAMRAARAFDAPGGVDLVRDATTAGIERIKGWEEEYPRIFKISQEAQDSAVRRAIFGGVQGWVPSLAFGSIGAVAGTVIGGPAGTMVGFGLGAGGMFGMAEYDQFMEDAENQGISRDEAFPYAIASALVEGGGEAIADMLAFKLLGTTGGAIAPFKGSIKQMMKVAIKPLALAALKQMPVEVGTEMVQGSSQVMLRNMAGVDAGEPWKAALEAIGPAMVMTMLFGASGGVKQGINLRGARKALENGAADPTVRQNAADFVTAQLGKVDKDLAELWKFNTRQYIEAGYDIPIDRATSEYLAWGEFSKYSPEMAEGLMQGKDIKLLPEGQGFVLVGRPYLTDHPEDPAHPNNKAEYDEYSPEMAEQLIHAKGTKLLPDGQGFTMAGDATVYSPQLAKKLKAEKEAAIETGTPEDIAQAERRLTRRQAEPAVPNRTLSLVRSALKATPEATIGDVYRSVKAVNPEASRQEVAKLVRQETQTKIPLTQKDLTIALKDLGQEEFNHQFNPVNVQAKLVKEQTDRGIDRKTAIKNTESVMTTYENNYKKVNEKALAARAKEQAKKEQAAEKAKKAAEGVKKKEAKPKAQKKKLAAKPKKKAALVQKKEKAKPTLKKAKAAESIAALDDRPTKRGKESVTGVFYRTKKEATQALRARHDSKELTTEKRADKEWIIVKKPLVHKSKPGTVTKIRKKGTPEAKASEKKREEIKAEKEEIKPSKIRAGVEVDTPDGKGQVIDSPQKDQWRVKMTDGWAKGEELIFAVSELESGVKDVKARLGDVVNKTYEEGVKAVKSTDNILVQKGKTQGKYLLIQLKSREKAVTNEDKTYDKVYDNREGYERPADFWEIPMWMGEAANTFEDSDIFIIRDVDKAIDELNKAGYPTIMFSVLDANKAMVKKIASKYKGKVVVGGYIDPKYFAGLSNVTFYDTVKQAAQALGEKYKPGVSYVHFKETETVPRLCLSKGCKHKCAFCVVPKTILTSTKGHVANQLKAFKDLKFKLIYIDDKTFGQADNYTDLVEVNKQIRKFNPDFQGFIIQTTAPALLKMSDQFIQDSGIQYIELGVESYNDDILSKVKKPHRTKQLDKAVIKIRKNGKAFIPNILVGLTGKGWSETRDSYENTVQFLERNRDIISHVNIYNLALYEGTELHEQLKDKADTEMNENVVTRAYHKEKDIHEEFYKRVLAVSSDTLDHNPLAPISLIRYMTKGTVTTMNPEVLSHRTGIHGEELKRLKDDADTPNRLHYYIEGGPEEAHIASLPFKYRAEVPAGRFYDTMSDPLNLRQVAKREGMAQADANLAEKIMKDHGYIGYYSQDRGPAIAVIFDKLKVTQVKPGETKARSSESYAKEAKAKQDNKFVSIIRRAFPTATAIRPAQGHIAGYEIEADDSFHVVLPNGARIQVKFNAMPELTPEQMEKFRNDYLGIQDITGQVPFALWVEDADASITGSGTVWLAGLGDLQTDLDHEVLHAAKSIVLTKAEDKQLEKDFGSEENQAIAYEKWRKSQRSHKIFDKVRSFFRRIAEAMGVGRGGSYQIFRMIEDGKVWTREFRGVSEVRSMGRVKAAIYDLMEETPVFKRKAIGQAVKEDIENDHKYWMHLGAVLYIEGINGRDWTAEMTAQLKEHYLLDKLPQGTVKSIRKSAQWIFKQRTLETLSGNLPTMEALMEMEQRGASEGGMVWYDERDGLSVMTESEDGEVVARSARAELEEYFGDDAEFMAGLIAHLSSGLAVPANTMKAIEVYIAHKSGLAFKGTHQVSENRIKQFLDTRLTSGPKRLPFFQAIMGDANAIVIDRWMARVMDFRTWDTDQEKWVTSTGASKAQRELLVAWVQRGAKRMGITPRAYQALIWAGKKALDEEASGRPTGSMDPLYKVIEDKIKVAGILAEDIPEGREGDYFILPGVDKWAINVAKFMPLKDQALVHTRPLRKPKELQVPKAKEKPLTAAQQKKLDAQQGQLFAKMSDSTVVEDSLDDIFGGKHKGVLQKMKDGVKRLKAWRTLILDEFHPILKHLGEKTYKLHRMLNGVHASVEAFMRHGKLKLDDDGHIVADGRNRGFAVWAKKHGRDAVNVLRWAAAKRSEQLERDNPEWLKNEEFLTEAKRERIYKEIGEAPEGGGTWEQLHAEFDEFHQSVLDIAEKAGLIDKVVREDWRDLIYVPFYRVFEDTATREEFLANPKKAKDIAAKVKPIKGSKRKIGEPIENVIANWGYMIQESMRNQARAEAYANAKMLNEVSDLMRDVDYQEIKHTIVNDKGVITYETERGDDMVLSFLDNGKRKYFSVHDADLYYALTTMNAQHFGKLFNAFFGGPKRLLTYGATFGPAFRVANAVRDTLHTWMITPGVSFTPFVDTFKGFISSMREDEAYVAALAAGGLHGGSYVHAEDPSSMSKFTKKLLGQGAKDSVLLDSGAKILEFWDRLGAASENAARVQLHKNLVEKGESGLEAAYQARDLLDFALKGQANIVLALIRTIPFLGARTQGNYRLARAAVDPKTRYSMALKGGILAAASLALWAAFKDDDRYKELEDYDKWTYYHFWIGDQHYRMPKPFEVGAIFSSMFESAANTLSGNEEMEFMARFFEHTFTETFAVGVPQTIKPLAELWANKSFFTGRPIEGRAMKLLEPGERAEPWTSETLQLLGKGLNISPKKMEALMRGYLATISTFMLGGTDQIARWVGDFPERPTYRSDDYPLVGRFWRQGPARNTKYATRLYEAMEESDRLVQTVKHYMILGDMEKAEKFADSNLGLFSANKMLNRIRKKMTSVRKAMKDVERSRTMSREEKRDEINSLTVLRNDLVREVYEVLQEEIK